MRFPRAKAHSAGHVEEKDLMAIWEVGNQPHSVHNKAQRLRPSAGGRQIEPHHTTPSCLILRALVAWVHAAGRPLFCESDKQKRAAVQILSRQSLCVQLAKLTLAVAGGRREEGGKEDLGSEQLKKKKRLGPLYQKVR